MEHKLTTVHEALSLAATEPQGPEQEAMATGSYRINKDRKAEAEAICQRHGTTLSAYLRSCAEVLVSDYKS